MIDTPTPYSVLERLRSKGRDVLFILMYIVFQKYSTLLHTFRVTDRTLFTSYLEFLSNNFSGSMTEQLVT